MRAAGVEMYGRSRTLAAIGAALVLAFVVPAVAQAQSAGNPGLKGRVEALEKAVAGLQDTVAGLKTTATNQSVTIKNLQSTVAGLKTTVADRGRRSRASRRPSRD